MANSYCVGVISRVLPPCSQALCPLVWMRDTLAAVTLFSSSRSIDPYVPPYTAVSGSNIQCRQCGMPTV